jgi:multiple sugar transport system substrate-binding protein
MADDAIGADRGLTRRRLLQGSALAVAGVAGCGGDGGNGNGDDDGTATFPEEMTFLHFETAEERRNAIDEIAEPWTEETGVSLNQRGVAEANLPARIGSDAAAGTLPATAELSSRALFSARGVVSHEDATQVVESIGEEEYYDRVLEFVTDDEGNYLGVPLYVWTQMLGYDEPYREENDLPVPDTWEDFETFAEESHDPDNDQFGCLLASDQSQFTLQAFQPFALSNDAHVFDEDGNVVFDEEPMVEALSFYGRMCREYNPPGEMGAGDVGEIWNNRQVYLYTTNTVGFYFEAAFIDDVVEGFGVVPTIDGPEKETTFGEVVSTTTFDVDAGARRASRSFQEHFHSTEGGADSPYITFSHLRPGLFNPTREGILNGEAYLDNEVIDNWPDEWHEEIIPNSIRNMERFGRRGDRVFPEIGDITGNFLITDAIRDVIDGDDAGTVASETAEEMRDLIN